MKIRISEQGIIEAIGIIDGIDLPSWITLANFNKWRYKGNGDVQLQSNWELLPILNSVLVDNQRAFCQEFQSELLAALRDEDLTNNQRVTLLTTIKDAMNVLSWGDAEVARVAFNSIGVTTLWTQPRKDWVLGKIDAYLR